jgi:hypothetical protein
MAVRSYLSFIYAVLPFNSGSSSATCSYVVFYYSSMVGKLSSIAMFHVMLVNDRSRPADGMWGNTSGRVR